MKKAMSILLAVMLLLSAFSLNAFAAGNSMSSATSVVLGQQYTGSITASDDMEFYRIDLEESGKLTVNTTVFFNVYYGIYGANGNTLDADTISIAYTGVNFKNRVIELEVTSGTYYFDFHRWLGSSDNTGDYNITFSFLSAEESFKEVQGGSNEKMATASEIEFNTRYNGQIALNETSDFYKFTVNEKTKVTVNLHTSSFVYSSVYDSNGAVLYESGGVRYDYYGGNATKELELEPGTYYYNVRSWGAECGNYFFTISNPDIDIEDPETPDDTNDDTDDNKSNNSGNSIWETILFFPLMLFDIILGFFAMIFGF